MKTPSMPSTPSTTPALSSSALTAPTAWLAFFLITLPALVTLSEFFSALRPIFFAAILLLLLIPVTDLLWAINQPKSLRFRSDEVIRGAVGQLADFDLTIDKTSAIRGKIRLAIPFPDQIRVNREIIPIHLVLGASQQSIKIRVTGCARGSFPLENLFWDRPSPLGFWITRVQQSFRCEFRFHHNLLLAKREVLNFLLHRTTGVQLHRQLGRGREFEKLREYQPGDDFQDLHWKATARRRHPITKVFRIEQAQQVYVAIDSSRLSARILASESRSHDRAQVEPEMTALEKSIISALLMGIAVERQRDQFGLITFSDKVDRLIAARTGSSHFGICRDALLLLRSRLVTPDFNEISATLVQTLRRRSLILFLTALDDPVVAEDFLSSIGHLQKKHLIVVAMIVPREIRPLFTGDPVSSVDEIYERFGSHFQWSQLLALQRSLRQQGVRFRMFPDDQAEISLVKEYMSLKQRQLL